MNYSNEVISYLQTNNILARKLDHALAGVREAVSRQVSITGAGATRMLYYISCFTEEYQDVCQQQKTEDIRFTKGVYYILRNQDVVHEMLNIYFKEIFLYKTSDQIEYIKKNLMAVNIHIAASSLTNTGFALATAAAVAIGMNLRLEMSASVSSWVSRGIASIGLYGVVQKAAESAHRLRLLSPTYYAALYAQELEMMYFLIEPLFERAGAFKAQWTSDSDIAEIITRMVQ
ncbi:hypothetical protein [Shimwellia blattae]|uniref:Uncharacterized protein n=1 Tax=Shimwellia blattae (strain ATCC 29907 / DSM 4481 / JCM 1650 / NBRC 105725 / CDC 9005-74) TaxID=630626 RepID=I2B9Y2_SHIBC|nr:hypothetical protein [Shimwellia blattae]AFJ47336.1 hypothetical protein EBL_c22450 [Shimwellia blattae DSM 4481 = NBRC 105725]GAB80469.1 hypothetical protein EB105725_05_01950 [Shimwellia blattae DSM 4481 = NBRC 105725]VDY64833.1 Uncharacterised protein [Shimwellia blattae]VEC22944.1 Uncharacterised protein [Shimwellia blattae]